MIIQYILNLDKARRKYTGSGKFELAGQSQTVESIPYIGSGFFELFGSAIAKTGAYNYLGSGQFQLFNTDINPTIPSKSVALKFNINDYGYDVNNDQYLVTSISNNAFLPIYTTTKLGKFYKFTDASLFVAPEIQAINSINYSKKIDEYKKKLNKIIQKIGETTNYDASKKLEIKFEIQETGYDLSSDQIKVKEILGKADGLLFKDYENNIFNNNSILTPTESKTDFVKKLAQMTNMYQDKLQKINQRLQNVTPAPDKEYLYDIKFKIGEYGKSETFDQNTEIFSIIGINSNQFYKTSFGLENSTNVLTSTEQAIASKKDYANKLVNINKKLQQINYKLNN